MGLIQSLLCSVTFCLERLVTLACMAFGLILIMFTIITLMAYGISFGYQYAQKQLAEFMILNAPGAPPIAPGRRRRDQPDASSFLLVDGAEDIYSTTPYMESLKTSDNTATEQIDFRSQTDKISTTSELSPYEKKIARQLLERFRRSKVNNTSTSPFFRLLKNSTLFKTDNVPLGPH